VKYQSWYLAKCAEQAASYCDNVDFNIHWQFINGDLPVWVAKLKHTLGK
jgi:hypothetical protein